MPRFSCILLSVVVFKLTNKSCVNGPEEFVFNLCHFLLFYSYRSLWNELWCCFVFLHADLKVDKGMIWSFKQSFITICITCNVVLPWHASLLYSMYIFVTYICDYMDIVCVCHSFCVVLTNESKNTSFTFTVKAWCISREQTLVGLWRIYFGGHS